MDNFCAVIKRRSRLEKMLIEKESRVVEKKWKEGKKNEKKDEEKKETRKTSDLKVRGSLLENEGILASIRSAINHFLRKRRPR